MFLGNTLNIDYSFKLFLRKVLLYTRLTQNKFEIIEVHSYATGSCIISTEIGWTTWICC